MQQHQQKNEIKGALILLLAAVIWGLAFVAQVSGASLSPLSFNAIRFTIGALVLLPVAIITTRKQHLHDTKRAMKASALCGCVLFIAMTCQQYGCILSRNAGESGFLASLSIIFVPLIGIFLGKRLHLPIVIAVVLSVLGLYLLVFIGGTGTWNMGDVLLIIAAFAMAVQSIVIARFAGSVDLMQLSFGQIVMVALLSWICAPFLGGLPTISGIHHALGQLLYTGILSTGVAYTLQIIGQKTVDPAPATIIMCLQSLFSVIAGAILLHEMMNWNGYLGCLLMLTGSFVAEIPTRVAKNNKAITPHIE